MSTALLPTANIIFQSPEPVLLVLDQSSLIFHVCVLLNLWSYTLHYKNKHYVYRNRIALHVILPRFRHMIFFFVVHFILTFALQTYWVPGSEQPVSFILLSCSVFLVISSPCLLGFRCHSLVYLCICCFVFERPGLCQFHLRLLSSLVLLCLPV